MAIPETDHVSGIDEALALVNRTIARKEDVSKVAWAILATAGGVLVYLGDKAIAAEILQDLRRRVLAGDFAESPIIKEQSSMLSILTLRKHRRQKAAGKSPEGHGTIAKALPLDDADLVATEAFDAIELAIEHTKDGIQTARGFLEVGVSTLIIADGNSAAVRALDELIKRVGADRFAEPLHKPGNT